DCESRHGRHQRVGARRVLARPRRLGDDHVGRVDLIAGHKMSRRDAQRRRHAGAVLAHVLGRVVRAEAAVEALIDALRHAAYAGEEGVADVGQRGERWGLDHVLVIPGPAAGRSPESIVTARATLVRSWLWIPGS